MVHCVFDPAETRLAPQVGDGAAEQFYTGRMFQRGRGLGGYGVHSGAGMGDVFRSVWRYLRPYAASAGKAIAHEGAATAQRILSNLAQGANLNETLRSEGKEGITRLLGRVRPAAQAGSGIRRKRSANPGRILHAGAVKGSHSDETPRAKRRKDVFGCY